MKKGRNPADQEARTLWEHVVRSVKAYAASHAPAAVPAGRGIVKGGKTVKKSAPPPLPPKQREEGLRLEARLDLHGLTQQEAFAALHDFIPAAAARGQKKILVITGKGTGDSGVLKRMLALWLEHPALKRYVGEVAPADLKDGGAGAFYVRLRKR